MKEKLSRNYCCRYYNNSAPFSFHFSTLQHQLNDLRIFEPNAQIFIIFNVNNQSPTYQSIKTESLYEETWLPSFVVDQ